MDEGELMSWTWRIDAEVGDQGLMSSTHTPDMLINAEVPRD